MPRSGVGGGKPDRTIDGVDDDSVTIYGDSLVNRWIDLAVAVRINISGAPSLSLLRIPGFVINPGVEPAEGLPARPAKERVLSLSYPNWRWCVLKQVSMAVNRWVSGS